MALPHVGRSAAVTGSEGAGRPRHIIHMVADGMSSGTLTCADYFSRLVRGRGLTWFELCQAPRTRHAQMNMRSLNSLVTDSAAAASSWGSGSRIVNGVLNMLPDGRKLTPLYSLFAEAGWKRGLVTTTEITHATPSGFAIVHKDRDDAQAIAAQHLERKVEVLLGGGRTFFESPLRKDRRDLKADFARAGYAVVQTAAELSAASKDQFWLGLFSPSHLPYTIDHSRSPRLKAEVPTLAAMTRVALGWLGRHDRFILQVEGGRVDHAAHNNDAAAAMHEMLAFDEALEACLEFQRTAPDTLIVVTTDHGTGNPGLNGTGTEYASSPALFRNLTKVKASFVNLFRHAQGKPDVDSAEAGSDDDTVTEEDIASVWDLRAILQNATGYRPATALVEMFRPFLLGHGRSLYGLMNLATVQLGQLMGNYTGIGWAGGAHTADFVPVLANGPGAGRFTGFMQNTDVFRHYTALAGIDFRNPELPLLAEGATPSAAVERVEEYALV